MYVYNSNISEKLQLVKIQWYAYLREYIGTGFDDSPSADGSREHVKRARATFTDSEMYGACADRLITIRI